VEASDGVYKDYANVIVKVENVNDNPPVFNHHKSNITIEEESVPPGCLTTVTAYDPDIPNRADPQNITYFVDGDVQNRLFEIDRTGCLKLLKPLNRDQPDGFPTIQVTIGAADVNGEEALRPLKTTTYIYISLTDINDNAPFLDMVSIIWKNFFCIHIVRDVNCALMRNYNNTENIVILFSNNLCTGPRTEARAS